MPAQKNKPSIAIYKLVFDAEKIADALHLSKAVIEKEFRDGRVASRFAEHWGASLYNYIKHGDTNAASSDGGLTLGRMGDFRVSVKCLSNAGIKFQDSKYVGSGRSCSPEQLVQSIRIVDRVLVVDIRHFPQVQMVLLHSRWLEDKAGQGLLKPGGWSADKLYTLLETDFIVEAEDFRFNDAVVVKVP